MKKLVVLIYGQQIMHLDQHIPSMMTIPVLGISIPKLLPSKGTTLNSVTGYARGY